MVSTTVDQRVCPSCEEEVHEYALSCPYCGTGLQAGEPETVASFEPPYQLVTPSEQNQAVPPYGAHPHQREEPAVEAVREEVPAPAAPEGHLRPVLMPASMLLSGAVFFLFGIVLLLFSQDGVMTLHWNGNLWPLFLLSSLPLLFVGWRSLQELEE